MSFVLSFLYIMFMLFLKYKTSFHLWSLKKIGSGDTTDPGRSSGRRDTSGQWNLESTRQQQRALHGSLRLTEILAVMYECPGSAGISCICQFSISHILYYIVYVFSSLCSADRASLNRVVMYSRSLGVSCSTCNTLKVY